MGPLQTASGNQTATLTVRAEAVGIWWFYPFFVQANAKADVELNLTTPDPTSLPLNSEERDISGCPDHQTHSGCYWHYEMSITPNTLKGRIKFELLDATSLKGHSTNMCFNADCTDAKDTGKDFLFDAQAQVQQIFDAPTDQGQTIQTTSDQLSSAKVVVASRDYGGKAWIRATFTIDGDDFSLTDSIPMDEDEDGIADSWEQDHDGDLEPTLDLELGANPATSPKGDGLSAFDEYRGFHTLTAQTAAEPIVHLRTDPSNAQDVFYWDSSTPAQCAQAGLGAGCFHTALREILAPRTPFASYWPMNGTQIHAIATANPGAGVNRVNENRTGGVNVYGIAYVDTALGANCGAIPPIAGAVGDAGLQRPEPIRIDLAQIQACGNLKNFPQAVWAAQVVAHETGHKFERSHPVRSANHVVVPLPITNASLQLNQYMRDPNPQTNRAYVKYALYEWPAGTNQISEQVAKVLDLGGLEIQNTQFVQATPPGTPEAAFALTMNGPIGTNDNRILIQIQQSMLMDWSPRFTLQQSANWNFHPTDLDQLKVKP